MLKKSRFSIEEMEAQYNLRKRRPEYDTEVISDWERRSVEARNRLDCTLDVRYGPAPRGTLDIFRAGNPGAPVLLYFHGGYWQRGHKGIYSFLAAPFVENGVTVVVASYDLCPDVTITELVGQTRQAAAFTRRNIDRYDGDPERLTVMGHSAGGHITGMLMGTDWPAYAADLPHEMFHAGIPVSALFELSPLLHTTLNDEVRMTAEEADRMTPMNHPPRTNAPQLVVVGDRESEEFHRQSNNYAEAFRTKERQIERYDVPGCDHFDEINSLADQQSEFFHKAMRLIRS